MKNILSQKHLKKEDGYSLAYTFILIGLILVVVSALLVANISETKQGTLHVKNISSFYIAQSGGEVAHRALKRYIESINNAVINNYDWTDIKYVNSYYDFLQFVSLGSPTRENDLVFYLNFAADNDYYLSNHLAPVVNDMGNGITLQVKITLLAPEIPSLLDLESGESLIFPMGYVIESEARQMSAVPSRSVITGKGSIMIKFYRGSFARFALFTDIHQTPPPSLNDIVFSGTTHFYGPVHTNGTLYFSDRPIFYDRVTSYSKKAIFYNNGNPVTIDADAYLPLDEPIFHKGFIRNVAKEPMPKSLIDLREATLRKDVNNPPKTVDYYIPRDANNKITGGIYFPKDLKIGLLVQGNKQIIRTSIKTSRNQYLPLEFILDYDKKQTTILNWSNQKVIETINSLPNGAIFVEGEILALEGMVQRQARLTIGAKGNIMIVGHIIYEEDPRERTDARNILGILSEDGNVIISNMEAPDNIFISATIMAAQGSFQVQSPDTIMGDKGTLTLLGGLISKYYGSLGQMRGYEKELHGYGRLFIYDKRTADITLLPIGFPKTDSLQWSTTREDGQDTFDLIIWGEEKP